MTSRPAPRSRAAGGAASRSAARRQPSRSSGGSPMPMVFGGVGVLVVVVVLVMMNSGGGKSNAAAPSSPPASAAGTGGGSSAAATPSALTLASAKAGKAPARPAPTLTREMIETVRARTAEASALYNEGVKARTAGDNAAARDKQAAAKAALDQINTQLADQLLWQEEAQLENWAQPAEYVTLEREYGKAMSLTKKIRMGGGK